MLMNDKVIEVASSGVSNSSNYQVAQSSKIMDMLSNALYSNKVKAPIRELSTNALDAHIMSGNMDKMPDVHLPTHANMNFKIRDYGTGLSPEQMDKVYKVYGISDKTHTNDLNGCMGIGSKSPYAYTNSFTTISYYSGMKYVYINSKGADGIPTLNLIHSEPTTEPNGLEVSFAVKSGQSYDFERETIEVFRWFAHKFNFFKDNKKIELNINVDRQLEGSNWAVIDRSVAVMGNVAYPICYTEMRTTIEVNQPVPWYSKNSVVCKYEAAIKAGLELRFDMGEVDFDISREKLQYTDKTKKAIRKAIDIVYSELEEVVKKSFEDCKSLWQKRLKLAEYKDKGTIYPLIDKIDFGFTVGKKTDVSNIQRFDKYNLKKKRRSFVESVSPSSSLIVYITDVPGRIESIKELVHNNTDLSIFIVPKAKCNEFMTEQGMLTEDIKFASSLPKPQKNSSNYVKTGNIFTLNDRYTRLAKEFSKCWDEVEDEDELEADAVYVSLDRYKPSVGCDPQRLKQIIRELQSCGIDVPTVYGIKESKVEGYVNEYGFKSLYSYTKTELAKLVKSSGIKSYVFNDFTRIQCLMDKKLIKLLNDSNELKILADEFEMISKNQNSELISLCSQFSVSVPVENFSKKEKSVLDKFPLLGILDKYAIGDNIKSVADYINSVS